MTESSFVPVPEPMFGALRFPIDVRIPSDVRYIERLVGEVAQRCAESRLPLRVCRLNIRVALTEALSNAILYGNQADRSKGVRVRATIDDRALVLEVEDEGVGFDVDACSVDPTIAENLAREDGRGLFLMRCFMDRVEWLPERGNVVRLTLHRS
jgi:serine/threonine-protein kinase RsbW